MTDSLFHNPYHFVPASSASSPGSVSRQPSGWPDHLGHAQFAATTLVDEKPEAVFSGRIVCRLTVEELLAIGGKQTKGSEQPLRPRRVELFTLDGKPAIPASSLRGMLSALAEAASNSTLRVLSNDKELLVRKWERGAMQTLHKILVHDWFRKIGLHLVPLQRGDGRTTLTLAEQLFGFVEEPSKTHAKKKDESLLALAGRLRPSNALLADGEAPKQIEPAVTKILASPKPPSPALYLTKGDSTDGGYVSKQNAHNSFARVQGRKFYLHRKSLDPTDWQTAVPHKPPQIPDKNLHQKAEVAPLGPCAFWFHLDFDNLSRLELELLCYVLHPTDSFRHQLGMGKPLGLGKVRIAPAGLFLVNRLARYQDDPLVSPKRYHQVWHDNAPDWPKRYQRERDAKLAEASAFSPAIFRDDYRKRIKKDHAPLIDTLRAIELLGNPAAVRHPVHYPQKPNFQGAEMESEHFRWWAENDLQEKIHNTAQFLRPLTTENTGDFTALPALDRRASSSPPPPPPQPLPPRPQDLVKTTQAFNVIRLGDGSRARFELKVGSQTVTAQFLDPSDFHRLPPGIQLKHEVPLILVKVDFPLSLVSLP